MTDTISTGAATVDLIPPSPDTDMSEETKVVVREAKREDMYQVCDLIRVSIEFNYVGFNFNFIKGACRI